MKLHFRKNAVVSFEILTFVEEDRNIVGKVIEVNDGEVVIMKLVPANYKPTIDLSSIMELIPGIHNLSFDPFDDNDFNYGTISEDINDWKEIMSLNDRDGTGPFFLKQEIHINRRFIISWKYEKVYLGYNEKEFKNIYKFYKGNGEYFE